MRTPKQEQNYAKCKRWQQRHMEQAARISANYRIKHPNLYLVAACKSRAKKYGMPFNITKDDVSIPDVCPVFGIPLIHGTRGFHENSPSIDRIVPEKGYTKGNIIVVSFKANRMKQNATVEELEKLASFYRKLEQESQKADSPEPRLTD